MPLIGINQPSPQHKLSSLEKVALIFDMANKAVSGALVIPEFLQKRKLGEAELERTKAETGQIQAEAQPLSEPERQEFRAMGVPDISIPTTRGLAAKLRDRMFETPGQKQSRERQDKIFELLAKKELREGRKEDREADKFVREMEQPVLTPAEKGIDEQFAKDYSDFVVQGGFADANKGISQIESVKTALQKEKDISGPFIGNVPRAAREIKYPRSIAVQDSVEEVIQRNLRLILGPQFTAQEASRLIERAYNPRLSQQENLSRMDRLSSQMRAAYKAKKDAAEYFNQHGTLKGWTGTLFQSANDFLRDEKDPDVDAYAKKFNLTYDQAKQLIESRRKK